MCPFPRESHAGLVETGRVKTSCFDSSVYRTTSSWSSAGKCDRGRGCFY